MSRVLTRAADPYPIRINSDARYSSLIPVRLFQRDADEAISFIQPVLLDPVQIDRPGAATLMDMFLPDKRIEYPDMLGRYLRIEAREAFVGTAPEVRPALLFVIQLPVPMSVSRVVLMGNLLLAPASDDRGPRSNFGMPRDLSIYAVDGWPSDLVSIPPHPRDWRCLFATRDLRANWGWTPISFHPAHASHLVFVMRDLPYLFTGRVPVPHEHRMESRDIHGISIQRLGIHAYEYGIHQTAEVTFSPVASWQDHYEDGFVSNYWSQWGVDPPVRQNHQSIYSVISDTKKYRIPLDHLPSALIGLPSQHLIGGQWHTAPGYSGDATVDADNATSLVVTVTEDEIPYVEAVILEEHWPRGPDNNADGGDPPDRTIRVFQTDDPEAAFSPYPMPSRWVPVVDASFVAAFEPYGIKLVFPRPVRARFYRFELVFAPQRDKNAPRRFALTGLQLLRSKHRTLVAKSTERYQVDQLELRLSGPSLINDYAFVNGHEIMDLVLESSTKGNQFRSALTLRSLLDMRERTRMQLIPNARQTRAATQTFHERALQGDAMDDPTARGFGTAASTRAQQVVDSDVSLGHTISVAKQTMVIDAPSDGHVPARFRSGQPGDLLSALPGLSTDRNTDLTDGLSLQHALQMLSDILGINIAQLLSLPNLANAWSGKSLTDLIGLAGSVLDSIYPFDSGDDGGGVIPHIPALNISQNADVLALFRHRFYGIANGAGPLPIIPFRPSVSLSGSFGGQFFGGGSIGISQQLDAGKSTAQTTGSQGQINEALTYHGDDNNLVTDSNVLSSDVSRLTTRHHLHERDEEYVWTGQEVRYGGTASDVVLCTIPVKALLQPNDVPTEHDSLRLRVGYLPPGIVLDVTFVGIAYPIAQDAMRGVPAGEDLRVREPADRGAVTPPVDTSDEQSVATRAGSTARESRRKTQKVSR